MIKRKRSIFLIILAAVVALLLLGALFLPVVNEPSGPKKISMPHELSFTLPQDWKEYKKPLVNQFVFENDTEGVNKCYLDVFVVRPDREYAFSQWLGTAITNQIFLETGKETSYRNMEMFIGNYNFVDNYFREVVNHQRAILKNKGTLVDLHMSYKQNTNCPKQFQQILDSLNF